MSRTTSTPASTPRLARRRASRALAALVLAAGLGAAGAAPAHATRTECGSWNPVAKASKLAWRPCYTQTPTATNRTDVVVTIQVANQYDAAVTVRLDMSQYIGLGSGPALGPYRTAATATVAAHSQRSVIRGDNVVVRAGENGMLSGGFTIKDGSTVLNTTASSWRIDIVNGQATT